MGFGIVMNDTIKTGIAAVALAGTLLSYPTSVRAQVVPTPQEAPRTIPGLVIPALTPTPTPTATPVPVPTGPTLGLPAPAAVATPSAAEPGRRKPIRPPASAAARPVAKPPVVSGEPVATSTARPSPPADVAIAPTPVPTIAASATPVARPTVTSDAPVTSDTSNWPWLVGGAVPLVVALAAWLWWRRRSRRETIAWGDEPALVDEPVPDAIAPVAPVQPAGPRARLAVTLRPTRAGLNMLSATVEGEVVVTNVGDVPAAQVRLFATLLSAHTGQDADLAAIFAAAPTGRPAAPPFPLAPGEERRVRIVAALSREAVRSMDAGGRPMFVPLVAIDVRYASDLIGTPGRIGQAFVVGVERVDSPKLAPFWLDGPLRMHDQIAARVQGRAVTD